jgi:hypothetical protein
MIDQGRHSIVPFYAQGSKKVYYYNFYYLQAVFFCCGLGIPALCEELNRTNHWHKNTPYSTPDPDPGGPKTCGSATLLQRHQNEKDALR